jgi:hypothetical protein
MIALACGAIVAAFVASPALSVETGSYAATADGIGLSLSLFAPGSDEPSLALNIGISHGELNSLPTAAGSASGIVEVAGTTATTDAPPDDDQLAEIVSLELGNANVGALAAEVARGTSASLTSAGPSTANRGELVDVRLFITPGGQAVLGTPPFAVASESNITATATAVTSEAHSDEVVIPFDLGDVVVQPVCDLLGGISQPLGQACQDAVDELGPFTRVLTVRILPALAQCVLDTTTNTASVPDVQAALLSVQLFNQEPVVVSPGQTLDIAEGTPLEIHAVLGDTATTVEGSSASATASALRLDLLADPLPTVSIVASESSCAVTGEPARVVPPKEPPPELPVTGAPLGLIYLGGGLMLGLGLVMARFVLRRSA